MPTPTTVPIFFSVDDGYVPCLAVALTSIRANKNPRVNFEINILNNGLLPANQKRLAALGTSNFDIRFIAMDKVTRQISGDTNKLRGDYVTLTIYFRLFIADMFPQYDKAIYIDADTVAEDDLTTLFA
ncbi:glycosyl transferase, partial [Lacticaseibacillus rhamnosus]